MWIGRAAHADEEFCMWRANELVQHLDEKLTVLYRECQYHESTLFKSYFREVGMQYLKLRIRFPSATAEAKEKENPFPTSRLLVVRGTSTLQVKLLAWCIQILC
jgi:hypothetical protein